MQNDTSKYVVNIIPLQNINSSVSGIDATTNLTNQVTNLQSMINFDTKSVSVNTIKSFTTGATIQVTSPINFTSGTTNDSTTSNITTLTLESANISNLLVDSGTFVNCSAKNFITLSDQSVKEDIRPYSVNTSSLNNIQPYYFYYNGSSEKEVGLLAQEIESVFPACVVTQDIKYIKYNSLVAVLLGMVKDLNKRLEALEGL